METDLKNLPVFNESGNLPIFAIGDYNIIQSCIDLNILSYPAFVFMPDKEGIAFIDKDSQIIELGKTQILRVEELPPVEEGDEHVLYICNDVVYFFSDGEYKPVASDTELNLEEIKKEVENLAEQMKQGLSDLDEKTTQEISDINEKVNELDQNISEINSAVGVKFINMDELMGKIDATRVVTTVDEMNEALDDDSVLFIMLDNDLVYTTERGIQLRKDEVKYIDLCGYNVTIEDDNKDDNVYAILASNGATLNIYDSVGTSVVNAGMSNDYDVCLCVNSGATINVYGGTYTCGTESSALDGSITVYAYNGEINIYDGFFENESWNDRVGNYSILNLKNNSGSYILCYGGKFLDQDPADGDETDKITGATFLADGYKSVPTEYVKNDEIHILYIVTEE